MSVESEPEQETFNPVRGWTIHEFPAADILATIST